MLEVSGVAKMEERLATESVPKCKYRPYLPSHGFGLADSIINTHFTPLHHTHVNVYRDSFAKGLRNPFRLAMDPNTKDKVKFYIGDVGASTWEEISVGGTDYAKANYGWPDMEGPCEMGSTTNCPAPSKYKDPFYYYQHRKATEGGAVTGSAFVPDGLWPSKYKFLFVDFIFGAIYSLSEDSSRKCRSCKPPVPGYRNETFHKQDAIVDIFFGPYKRHESAIRCITH
jgi:hypothetical protein